MRKISLTLGIIGSVLALVIGCFTVYDACYRTFWDDLYGYSDEYYSDEYYFDDYYYDGEYDSLAAEETLPDDSEKDVSFVEPYIDPFSVTSGCSMILGGLLGVIGSLLMKRSHTSAGILYIIAAVLTVPSSAFIGGVLFVIAAVFALKRERPAGPAMYAPGYYPVHPFNGEYRSYGSYPPTYPTVPAGPVTPVYPPYGAYPPPYSPPVQQVPSGPTVPSYPPYGAYPPPYPAAPSSYAPQAYAPYSSYPPPPPAYGSAWPPAPAAGIPQPTAPPVPSDKEQP